MDIEPANSSNSLDIDKNKERIQNQNLNQKDDSNNLSNEQNSQSNELKNISSSNKSSSLICPVCNKKIKLFESTYCKCRCGSTFCSKHRHPQSGPNNTDGHVCTFNYVADEIKKLEKLNPKINFEKVNKI